MIQGLNIRCNIGPFQVLRSPMIKLSFRRRDVVSVCEIEVPDSDRKVQTVLAKKQPVQIRFGLRGSQGLWQEWEGTVKDFVQSGSDILKVSCVGPEQALIDTKITQAMSNEPADIAGKRILQATGLPVASVSIPSEVFPHLVFSNVSAARAIKQLSQSLERSFGHDLTKHAVWLGEAAGEHPGRLYWSDQAEPGPVYVVETASNLLTHSPNPDGMSRITSTLLPGLTASRMIRIRDVSRDISGLFRAEEVTHILSEQSATTIIGYGCDQGWG